MRREVLECVRASAAFPPAPAVLPGDLCPVITLFRSEGIKETAEAQAGLLHDMRVNTRNRLIHCQYASAVSQRQPVKPHHLPALLHELELGIGRQPFQWPMRPFAGGRWDVYQPIIALDKGFFQSSNLKNERN